MTKYSVETGLCICSKIDNVQHTVSFGTFQDFVRSVLHVEGKAMRFGVFIV